MSWLDSLLGNVGRGAEDIFSLGGTELARKFGGQGAKNVLNPLATGLGANFATGAAGGAGIMGGEGLGLLGGGAAGAAGAGGAGGGGGGGGGGGAPLLRWLPTWPHPLLGWEQPVPAWEGEWVPR